MLKLTTAPSEYAHRRQSTASAVHPSMRSRCEVCQRDADEVHAFRCVRGCGFAATVRICPDCLRGALGLGRRPTPT